MIGVETVELRVLHGRRVVVDQVSVKIGVGELVGVLGPNGAGKSSLLGAIVGELPVHSGKVLFDGRSLVTIDPGAQARARAVLPQHAALAFNLAVTDLVGMGAYPFPEASPDQVTRWVRQSMEDAAVEYLASARYVELSGGEAQRVQFARVLVQARAAAAARGHAYLFLDEPTSSLDPRHQYQLMQRLHQLSATGEFGILVVLHDINLAAQWCSRLVLLHEGRAIGDAPPQEALTEESLKQVFGVPMRVLPHPLTPGRILVLAGSGNASPEIND